jgi:hypothetical protein
MTNLTGVHDKLVDIHDKLVGMHDKLAGIHDKLVGIHDKLVGVFDKLVGIYVNLVGIDIKLVRINDRFDYCNVKQTLSDSSSNRAQLAPVDGFALEIAARAEEGALREVRRLRTALFTSPDSPAPPQPHSTRSPHPPSER